MAETSNGTTFTFAAAEAVDARTINFSENGNPIDISVLGSTHHIWEVGMSDYELSIETVGQNDISVGDSGTIVIAWADSSTDDSPGTILCTAKDTTANLDNEITCTLTFKPIAT